MTFRSLKFSISKSKFFIFFSDLHLYSSSGTLTYFPSLSRLVSLFPSLTVSQSYCVLYLALQMTSYFSLHSRAPPLFKPSSLLPSKFYSDLPSLACNIKFTIWLGIPGPHLFSASIGPIPATYVHMQPFHIPCQPLPGSPSFSTEQVLIHYLRLGKNMAFFGCVP